MGFKAIIRYTLILSCVFYGTIIVILLQRTNMTDKDFLQVEEINDISKFDADVEIKLNNVKTRLLSTNSKEEAEKSKTDKANRDSKSMEAEKVKIITTKNVSHFVNRLPKKRQILAEMWDNYNKLQQKTATKMLNYSENTSRTRNNFQAVGDDIYVFSAYHDNRQISDNNSTQVIRIITLSRLKSEDNLLCKFLKSRVDQWVLAIRQEMSDNHEKLFGGVMYICTIPPSIGDEPPSVVYLRNLNTLERNNSNLTGVTEELVKLQVIRNQPLFWTEDIRQVLKLDYTRKYSWQDESKQTDTSSPYENKQKNIPRENKGWKINYQGRQPVNDSILSIKELPENDIHSDIKIAMCVPPIFGNVRISDFIQFIEIHRILGVGHFIFYPMNISHDINHMLNYYQFNGLVTTVQWTLPRVVKESTATWYNGQIVAMQDCLYRTMGNFNFTAFLDLDEVIIPRKSNNWQSMLQELDTFAMKSYNEEYASYKFKSGFFGMDPNLGAMATDNTPSNTAKNQKLSFLNKIHRNKNLSNVRTKVIVKPDYIEQIGIHHVANLLDSNSKMADVPDDSALIHHYRKCTTVSDEQMHCGKIIEDATVLKYSNLLTNNYHSTLDKNVKYFKKIKMP